MPVVKGEKWAANLWIHQNDFQTPYVNRVPRTVTSMGVLDAISKRVACNMQPLVLWEGPLWLTRQRDGPLAMPMQVRKRRPLCDRNSVRFYFCTVVSSWHVRCVFSACSSCRLGLFGVSSQHVRCVFSACPLCLLSMSVCLLVMFAVLATLTYAFDAVLSPKRCTHALP
jgi:hypothetical protein